MLVLDECGSKPSMFSFYWLLYRHQLEHWNGSLILGLVDIEKPFRIFDMRKFQQNVNRELRRTNPARLRYGLQIIKKTNNFSTNVVSIFVEGWSGEGM